MGAPRTLPDFDCLCCGKTFKRKFRGTKFCSRKCYVGFSLSSWYIKGATLGKYQHTEIAEAVLGRPLRKGEMVHHVNMNKRDNRHSNLVICDQKYHRNIHHQMELIWVREHCTSGS